MKLRLKGDSIRLRLTQGEVTRLVSDGVVEENLSFPGSGGVFTYALESADWSDVITAVYDDDRMRVIVPASEAATWAGSTQVGIYGDANGLRITVEKDFACIKPRVGEDESDMFPHPDPGAC